MSKSLYTSLCLLGVFILGGTVESLAADSGTLKQYLLIAEHASFLAVTDEDFETSIRLRIEDAGGEFVSYSFRGVGAKNYLVVRFPTSSALEAFLGNAADAVEVIEMGPGPTVALAAATAGEVPSSPALGEPPKEVAGVQPDVEPAAPPVPGAWKRINSRWVNAEPFTGLFLDFVRFCQGEDSRNQVGDLNDFDNPEIRGQRAGFQGTLNFKNPWRWAIFGAYNGFNAGFERGESPVWSLFDLWVEIPVPKLGFVTVGKAKEPFSMERMMAGGYMGFMERAVGTDTFTPSRTDGVSVKGTFAGKRMNLGSGYSVSGIGKERDTGHSWVGRLAGLPLDDPHGKGLLHVAGEVRYANVDSFRFRVTPEVSNVPDFVDTDPIPGDGATYLLGEVYYRRKSFFFASEQLYNWVRSSQNGDPFLWSAFAQATWTVTGEGRDYDYDRGVFRIMTPQTDVIRGGSGLLELGLRYSTVDLDDAGLHGGTLSRLSASVSWYMRWNIVTNFVWGLARRDRLGATSYTQEDIQISVETSGSPQVVVYAARA